MINVKEEFLASPKLRRAVELGGHEAIVFWLFLKGYAAQNPADGFIPDEEIDRLGVGIVKAPRKKLEALVACGKKQPDGKRGAGLVDPAPHGWQLHDYEDHANSRTDEEVRRVKQRLKKQEQRRKKSEELERLRAQEAAGRTGTTPPVSPGQKGDNVGDKTGDIGGDNAGDTKRDRIGDTNGGHSPAGGPAPAQARDPARSQPSPAQPSPSGREEIPPPPAEPDRGKRRFEASFSGIRADVVDLHDAYRTTFGLTGHVLTGASDVNAMILADAVDRHGLPLCRAMLEVAPEDRMVNGEGDERGMKHEKIAYVFGNADTVARLIRAVEAKAKAKRKPDVDPLAAAFAAEPS